MKSILVVDSKKFGQSLATIMPAVATKSSLPVLSMVLLSTTEDRLELVSTDLQLSIRTFCECETKNNIQICLPAKRLYNWVAQQDGNIKIEFDNFTAKLKCGRFKATLKGLDAEEFPVVPSVSGATEKLEVDGEKLRNCIDQVINAAASDDTRPALSGIYWTNRLAAADGYQMGVSTEIGTQGNWLIPAKNMRIIRKAFQGFESVTVFGLSSQLGFLQNEVEIVTRLIEGNFPNYQQILDQHSNRIIVEMSKSELEKTIRVVETMLIDDIGQKSSILKFDIEPNKMLVSSQAGDTDADGEIEVQYEGESFKKALNIHFLRNALNAVGTDRLQMQTGVKDVPVYINNVPDDGFVYVVMPLNLSSVRR